MLQHLDICKRFTHGRTSQRMTSGEERSHSALLASKPVLQKHDECALGLTGGVHTGQLCRASRQCAERPQQPPAHRAHHPPLCTKPLLVHAQSCRFLRSRVREHVHTHQAMCSLAWHGPCPTHPHSPLQGGWERPGERERWVSPADGLRTGATDRATPTTQTISK